ncbi:hypothetical protein PanWU01x14_139710 [Parasponia andersonii]|uniref:SPOROCYTELESS-like EAR-containing protein n=1 Tax=Parasponia andersonii TaxID=3476 RepID=A0A2P5CML0_PARAD|nr:hypothetical protein PanWU01x14_139710 [Parasponia andersonii]
MGSGYYGEPNLGNERGSGSSSKKGKKSNSDKPRQPQRGLGVAQLEKIRLHGQMGCSAYGHPSLHPPYPSNFNNDDHMRVQTAYSAIPSSSFSYSSSSSSSSASYGFNPNIMMGLGEYERTNIRSYGDSQPTTTARWDPSNGMLETQYMTQPNMTRHLLNPHVEDSQHMSKGQKHRSNSMGSSSQNSESSDTQELDLELRLSL